MKTLIDHLANYASYHRHVRNVATHFVGIPVIVVSVMAPMGDLVESMFKRNLDVKDFGTFIPGHGGVLDRFDWFLFVLPGAYYLMLVIQPWVK